MSNLTRNDGTFLVQFLAFRRGIPEVSRALYLSAADGMAALEQAKGRVGMGVWPRRTDALRVLDHSGRIIIDWIVPTRRNDLRDFPVEGANQDPAVSSGGQTASVQSAA